MKQKKKKNQFKSTVNQFSAINKDISTQRESTDTVSFDDGTEYW